MSAEALREPTHRLFRIHALLDEVTSSPWSHDVLELGMAVVLSLQVSEKDESALVWLIIVGPPSDGKTFTVLLLKTVAGVYCLDTVTENFLASGYRDQTGKAAPDLFKDLNGKCVVIKEFGTVLSLRPEKVRKFLGDFQAIYDREYSKATGTVGTIRGKAAFSMVACATPATLHDHHQYMARIGPRFLMYRAPDLTEADEDDGLGMLWDGQAGMRKAFLDELRELIKQHVDDCVGGSLNLNSETPEQQRYIDTLAKFVACGRTAVRRRKIHDPDSGRDRYELEVTQHEKPFRVQQQLRNLGRGLALVHGRPRVTDHELELLRRVAVASLPTDRADVLSLFPDNPDRLTVKVCAAAIEKSEDRARQLLEELVLIKLLKRSTGESKGGSPSTVYLPVPRFADILNVPVKPLDHAVDLTGDFTDKTDTPETTYSLEREGLSGQSYRRSPVVGEGGNA
jgi:hypothetical protein